MQVFRVNSSLSPPPLSLPPSLFSSLRNVSPFLSHLALWLDRYFCVSVFSLFSSSLFLPLDRHAIMNATDSNSGVNGNDSNNTIAAKTNAHGNSVRLQSVIGKQSSCVRKMSTMPEEEDASDDMDPDVIRIGHQHHYQHHHDADSDSPVEERGRLLSITDSTTAHHRKIAITPSSSSNLHHCNGLKKAIPRNDSGNSIHERAYSRLQQSRSGDQVGQPETRLLNRDNPQGILRSSARGIDSHGGGRYRCSSVRSVKSNPTMDEHHHQYHPPAASWASIVFSDGNGQTHVRTLPDSVSIRSLASIGMGSSNGRKLTIRRVLTSPSELLNMVHPPP